MPSPEAAVELLALGYHVVGADASTAMLDRAKIESKADGGKYDEVWMERNAVSGFGSGSRTARGEQPHEVLEFHDGFRVLTVLDRTWLVQADENACCGLMPWSI